MKKKKNTKSALIFCTLLSFAFILLGLSFFANNNTVMEVNALEFQSENANFLNDKNARLFTVLNDKLTTISDSNNSISDIKTVYGFNGNALYLTNTSSKSTLMSTTSVNLDGSIENEGYNWFKNLDTCGYYDIKADTQLAI